MRVVRRLSLEVVVAGIGVLAVTGCGGGASGAEPEQAAPVQSVERAATSDLLPTADTFVKSDDASPGTDRGGWNYVSAKGGTPSQLTYFQFSVGAHTSSVASAKLRLYCYDSAACSGTVTARQVADDQWSDTMTWFNRKPTGAVISSVSASVGWMELDLTGFVNAQIAGDKVVSVALETSGAVIKWRSLENTLTAERPVLRIDPGQAWWKRSFVSGKSRYMGRPWNVGSTFYNTADGDQLKWNNYMGAQADVHSGSLVGPDSIRADSWAKVSGGDLSDTVTGVLNNSQLDLHASDHMRYWLDTAPADTWGVFAMTTVPHHWKPSGGTYLDGWEQVGNGAYDTWYFKMGQRMRWYIDNQTNKDYRFVILRPNWEMNQDTGFKPGFFDNGGYVKLYNRMMKHFADNFRAGYGYNVPIVFSPAAQPSCLRLNKTDVAGACTSEYADFFEYADVYQLADVSYHPSKSTASTTTQVQQALNGRSGAFTLNGEVIPLARARGIAVSVTEWSPRYEAPPKSTNDYFAPLADVAVHAFADLLEANSDIVAFTCAHHDSFVNERFWMSDDPSVKGPIWMRAVQAHKARFGRVP